MENNNSVGGAIVKIMALTGGAIAGAMLANWCDKILTNMIHERAEFDKTRYSQGLASREFSSQGKRLPDTEPRIIRIEHVETQEYPGEGDL
ncbi:hypothetical protein [Dictyobacter aurantiacus]|uniref:Uncharacterized protein n=1 Tax=Dictyobacter aurantiacus TaxID=1936993 RepID=A0A401ZAG7_9CHLR|nr:hypothetical protein [Dictyobacter aurantiacus]GCE03860.1 hypothetical protein KDAU_11890 [Dictyobacter aurantiacus]